MRVYRRCHLFLPPRHFRPFRSFWCRNPVSLFRQGLLALGVVRRQVCWQIDPFRQSYNSGASGSRYSASHAPSISCPLLLGHSILDDPCGGDAKAYRTTRIFGPARVTSSPDLVNSYRSVPCRVQVDVAKDISPSRIVQPSQSGATSMARVSRLLQRSR